VELTVLTINTWSRSGPWDQRYPLLRRQIEAIGPDVIGMQEVLSDGSTNLAAEIVEGLGYEVAFGRAKKMGMGIAFGNAILSRHPFVGEPTVVPLPNADTRDQRCLVGVEIDTPAGRLPFWCTHLAFRPHHGFVREAQVVAIANAMESSRSGEGLAPILVGDLNARPEATEMRFLRGLHSLEGRSCYLIDAFGEAGTGDGFTRDPARNPFAARHHERARRIDYVFVGPPDAHGRGVVTQATVALDEVVDGVAGSDHFGVCATIRY